MATCPRSIWWPCPTCRDSSHYPDPIPETALAETVLTENSLTDIAYQSRYLKK